MEGERAGWWVSAPQGKGKKSSSTLETPCTLKVLVVVVVVGGVHILERGTAGHSPTIVLVHWAMNSTVLRQWVERLVHGAPPQSSK